VGLANTAVIVDLVVENWLGHGRIVSLIVTAQAVAQQVNEDVLAEATTVLGRQLAYPNNCCWVITVDVEDRAIKALSQVGGVVGRAGRIRGGGEANLVADHTMYSTAGGVATQLGQVDGLLDHAETSERSIAVQHQRNNGVAVVALVQDVLLCATHTTQDRVYCFQVGWVSGQGD